MEARKWKIGITQLARLLTLARGRIAAASILIAAVLGIYIMRLGWLQLIEPHRPVQGGVHTLLQRSIIQRERGIVLDDGRGSILDRSGRPYTGAAVQAAVLFPVHRDSIPSEAVRTLALWFHTTERDVQTRWESVTEPLVWPSSRDGKLPHPLTPEQSRRLNASGWDGVRSLPITVRYPLGKNTPQWIGFVAQSAGEQAKGGMSGTSGMSGLERSFEPLLRSLGPTILVHYTDADQRPLYGLDIRIRRPDNPYYPLQLVTTADREIEAAIGRAADEAGMTKGSVVVLDAATRDIVAMVSRPAADPNHVMPEQGAWNNRALKALPPGSVYKLFIAAAALEAQVTDPQEQFHCSGDYGKYGLACWLKDGHGTLTLREALAESCNVVFAELAERMSAAGLEAFAKRAGLAGIVGMSSSDGRGHNELKHFDGEEASRIFAAGDENGTIDGGERAQLGIGQRNVRLTPLAAANYVATLLQDGAAGEPRLVQELRYANGLSFARFAAGTGSERVMKPQTARQVRRWMEDTVAYGTGQWLRQAAWRLAGKSGTAQADAYGSGRLHTWFVGYGPVEKPKYAVSVVFEDEPAGTSHRATALFGKVMDLLAEHGNSGLPRHSTR
ncbi:penicillin-binding transpeptidase domain-containing protein [Paenibacillus thiaminolyticus]|uniref:peptidoglycan D,D-transpeptidase FtsI family protein n=1 Tax=Paenibacillus thiaminolyticus TaxID=49283 RepID=UPI003D26BB4C